MRSFQKKKKNNNQKLIKKARMLNEYEKKNIFNEENNCSQSCNLINIIHPIGFEISKFIVLITKILSSIFFRIHAKNGNKIFGYF